MKKLTLGILLLLLVSSAAAFTLSSLPRFYCYGYAVDCGTFHNMRSACLSQSGCGWIGGDPYGKCVPSPYHYPCRFYFTKSVCERNWFCEWRIPT